MEAPLTFTAWCSFVPSTACPVHWVGAMESDAKPAALLCTGQVLDLLRLWPRLQRADAIILILLPASTQWSSSRPTTRRWQSPTTAPLASAQACSVAAGGAPAPWPRASRWGEGQLAAAVSVLLPLALLCSGGRGRRTTWCRGGAVARGNQQQRARKLVPSVSRTYMRGHRLGSQPPDSPSAMQRFAGRHAAPEQLCHHPTHRSLHPPSASNC